MIFSDIVTITNGKLLTDFDTSASIQSLIIDSRKPFLSSGALFFAIKGERHDGHLYIPELKKRGVKNFVVTEHVALEGVNILKVRNAVDALQALAKHHREKFSIPVIGITGSNGKTIIKEWLYTCLSSTFRIVKSPQSFNSQLGVPLSVWNITKSNNLALFEAGISKVGEMRTLADIIQPTIGIFTNLGSAHDEGFESREQKFKEKAQLFDTASVVIHNGDNKHISFGPKSFSWGLNANNDIRIVQQKPYDGRLSIKLLFGNETYVFRLPFNDEPSIENCMHCISYMLHEQMSEHYIQDAINRLQRLGMRLELKRAINRSYVIDDTYNNDLIGLQQAISFLSLQNQRSRKIAILSDVYQSGLNTHELYSQIAEYIESAQIDQVIAVGPEMQAKVKLFRENTLFFDDTQQLLDGLEALDLSESVILIKGARSFSFERIVQRLVEKIHGTVLEINLDALTNNLNYYRSKLDSRTKIMVMVKAFAYGSGSFEVANLLQFHRVDYLGVAYADEGVQLRKNGIYLPIMVMNANEESFESLCKYNLEPVMYDLSLLEEYLRFLDGEQANIHIELDTGMKRLGFGSSDIPALVKLMAENRHFSINTIFSHLAGADEGQHDEFSKSQAEAFRHLAAQIKKGLAIEPILHLLNSPGIVRYPQYHFDMVRLGIGLYGLEANNEEQEELQSISTLKTIISQIRQVKKGESVGYGRVGRAEKDMRIATIAIGYADGFTRSFSNGLGEVWVNGKRASVIGNVCMDMTMIDITDCEVEVGDEVEVFGENISIIELAKKINTIPYEILTNVSQRVKRVYYTS